MKRFEVKDNASGAIGFSYIADQPMDPQPEWGALAWTEQVLVLDEAGIPVLGADGLPTFQAVEHQATYTVVVTDLTGTREDPAWIALRTRRNELLRACDWTQMPDNQLEANVHASWEIYRQALRALPETTADPSAPVWPAPPGSV